MREAGEGCNVVRYDTESLRTSAIVRGVECWNVKKTLDGLIVVRVVRSKVYKTVGDIVGKSQIRLRHMSDSSFKWPDRGLTLTTWALLESS